MPNPTSVSRRLESAIRHSYKNEFEESLIHLFPAIDKTAKTRYNKLKPGARFKQFLDNQQNIISVIATNNYLRISVNGTTFPDAIYKFARNPLLHEGELDKRIRFNNMQGLEIGEVWNLPPAYILGLCVATVVAEENANEWIDPNLGCTLWGTDYSFNELWAKPHLIEESLQKSATPG